MSEQTRAIAVRQILQMVAERRAELVSEHQALNALEAAAHEYLDGIDSPAPSLTPVDSEPGEGEAPRVAVGPLPATEQPEQAKPKRSRDDGHGRAARSGTPAPAIESPRRARGNGHAPEGTPAAADTDRESRPSAQRSDRREDVSRPQVSGSALPVSCPQCDRPFKNSNGLSIHIGKAHLETAALLDRARAVSPVDALERSRNGIHDVVASDAKDPREIHENCPDCDQLFTWQPAFIRHKQTCRGRAATA